VGETLDVAVIGAGPYGLSVAAHLRGLRTRAFGTRMETWRTRMPVGMLLRSAWAETSLAAPSGAGTIDAWAKEVDEPRQEPIRLETFLRYADWFAGRFVDELEEVDISHVDAAGGQYALVTSSGDELRARRLVLAVGAAPFAYSPAPFDSVSEGISFALDHRDFAGLRGQRVAIVGGGQSALDAASLAVQAGVETELVVRSRIHWFADREPHHRRGPARALLYRLAYPVVGYGPPPLNRLALHPDLFASLPLRWRDALRRRMLRAGGSPELHRAVAGTVRLTEGAAVEGVRRGELGVELQLSDGTRRQVDHVVVAAGYRFSLDRLPFLSAGLRARIGVEGGWPRLDRYFRSTTEPSLLFAGYAAEGRFGPVARYVLGTEFTAGRVASYLRSSLGSA
jgi:FAD-dependent urate hydroxylase